MKLERLPHNPGELLEFYEAGLTSLGALCERTWHDRLVVVGEGPAARLWHPDGSLHEMELHFAPADATSARDAAREVFPGCPLTFRLAEALRASPLPLERFVLPDAASARPPETAVLEKLWRAQFPDTGRWQLAAPPRAEFHFSLLSLVRFEIQAMDQHWSLHRVAVSLADGQPDSALARDFDFYQTAASPGPEIAWSSPDPTQWRGALERVLQRELEDELETIRARQENSLRRELERIDDYFEGYERELTARAKRGAAKTAKAKTADRLAAAKAEHERRRADQLARHEIRVLPHLDALLLLAENALRAQLRVERFHRPQELETLFVPRSRQWRTLSLGRQR
jgi:hypothetical protein